MKIDDSIPMAYPHAKDSPDGKGWILTYQLNKEHPQYEDIKRQIETGEIKIGIVYDGDFVTQPNENKDAK